MTLLADPVESPAFPPPDAWECDQCHRPLPNRVGLSVVDDAAPRDAAPRDEEPTGYGFCSIACFVTFVRRRWIEGR